MHKNPVVDEQNAHDAARIGVIEAIARTLLVTARYNGQTMTLAPHALFARHGELFVSALNLTKNWRTAEDMRLGLFKLKGLAQVSITTDHFDPLTSQDPLPGQDAELLLSVM